MIGVYIELGFDHILDPEGYDHILFVIALCAIYLVRDWRKILILVTAFTIGHSLTLALSSLKLVNVSASFIEMLIPITIVLTCFYNILKSKEFDDEEMLPQSDVLDAQLNVKAKKVSELKKVMGNYVLALGFGFIHGLGFSNFFKALMGQDESILMPLFSFNIGVELGQIIIVFATLALGFVLVNIMGLKRKYYTIGLSSIIAVWAIWLMF